MCNLTPQAHNAYQCARALQAYLHPSCVLCPRNCQTNRLSGKKGFCGGGADLVLYTAFLHQGEEPGITAGAGSGALFFSGCNLKCCYCQNWQFSHTHAGRLITSAECARIMLNLQKQKAANINLVTPTHYAPLIMESLAQARQQGLAIPIIYNTSGYEKTDILEHLAPCVDVYIADMRYWSSKSASEYSSAADYPAINQKAILAMYHQKKNYWNNDALKRGLIIRHLVLPGLLAETNSILRWIAKNTPQALVSVMFQYQPYYQASQHPEINRTITQDEHAEISKLVENLGIAGWIQDFTPQENLAGIHFKPLEESLLD